MARNEMLTVFVYDVSQNKRRRRISALLEGQLTRVQRSVFEGRLRRAAAEALAQRAAAHLGPGDGLRLYTIGRRGAEDARSFGDGPPIAPDGDYWIV